MKTKFDWIKEHLLCPTCFGELNYSKVGGAISCVRCGKKYSYDEKKFNMLNYALMDTFNIVETENVSDHPYDSVSKKMINSGHMVLDCGAGKKVDSYDNVVQMEVVAYPNVDVLAVNQRIPFKENSFDAIISLNVLEHVDDPFRCANEIIRVLRPGGELYVNVPFLHREHGYPHHYFNMTRMGAKKLFADKVDILDHYVPKSGHPIFALYLLLDTYLKGLPKNEADIFRKMTVEDFLQKPPKSWLEDDIVKKLDLDSRWRIATTTTLIMKKRIL